MYDMRSDGGIAKGSRERGKRGMIESGEPSRGGSRGESPAAAARDAAQRELWARTAAVAGRLNRAHGELVSIVVELVEGKHWGDGGFRSPEHYLIVRAG